MCKVEVLQGGVCLERPLGVRGEEGVRHQGRYEVVLQFRYITYKCTSYSLAIYYFKSTSTCIISHIYVLGTQYYVSSL